jgi:hypothetical protein
MEVFMKKLILAALITVLAMSTVFAQGQNGAPKSITVNGTLQLRNGQIAVVDGSTAYFVPALERYIGFIDSLKEGASVSVEGYAWGNYLEPSKVTIGGKSYDFQPSAYGGGTAPGYGYGCGGYGHHGGGIMGYDNGRSGYGHHGGYGRRW